MRTDSNTDAVQPGAAPTSPSVVSAFAMLDLVAQSAGPVTMIEVARALGLPKSSVSRVLRTLEDLGALARDPDDRRYELGPKIEAYSRVASTPRIAQLFQSIAAPIVQPINETTQLGILAGTNVKFVSYLDSTRPVRLITYAGRTLPAHASAAGKAILAFIPTVQLEHIIRAGLPAVTENTITDRARLFDDLAQTRERGYAVENEESADNLSCIAAPVLDKTGHALAAITMCFPAKTISAKQQEAGQEALLAITTSLAHALQEQAVRAQ